jgi:hypothetical protein
MGWHSRIELSREKSRESIQKHTADEEHGYNCRVVEHGRDDSIAVAKSKKIERGSLNELEGEA